ncbi:hypothetical protein V6N13_069324 [Hibiscus sabdariffa]|uniref:KIB1-4 beta-propeller domain-containing protein n=1 Tax=Hibiscus sabdariffa TaxID=183260 RepID=A0ABR2PFY5_9ROSI
MTAYCSRSPRFLRAGENEWIVLENVKSIEDIVYFDGKFYAIDGEGTIIAIDQYLNVSFLGGLSSGSDYRPRLSRARKFLVKSGDNLLAVEKLWNPYAKTPSICCRSISSRVFRMNEEDQKWDEMPSLGDQILFLSIYQAISAPCCGRGNLIFCSERLGDSCDYTFVFDLETGATSLLANCPGYCNLFRPPPQWVTSLEHEISSTANLPERVASAGKEVSTPSSNCSFKFCCF